MFALFSPEILQAGAVKGLILQWLKTGSFIYRQTRCFEKIAYLML